MIDPDEAQAPAARTRFPASGAGFFLRKSFAQLQDLFTIICYNNIDWSAYSVPARRFGRSKPGQPLSARGSILPGKGEHP